ncbi:amyloid protein-binding protein 2-like [Centruroides sculpturatus]|uniref:amyloid protein-binding protein 2-like n=1 Tax=Centruroides sculpturatus TaxID=218467 RepID=UPI000C6EC093|nr:amyloid protein-binding protein 2-like [Centruroides sculpturatus]
MFKMASALHWIPDSLYNTAITTVVSCFNVFQKELRTFPENVLFDIYYKLYKQGRLCQLGFEFCNLEVFSRVLKVKDKRHLLHHCFQALMDHGAHTSEHLADAYYQHCLTVKHSSVQVKDRTIQLGLSLGSILSDAGWFLDAEKIMKSCMEICKQLKDPPHLNILLECCIRNLHNYHFRKICKNLFIHLLKSYSILQAYRWSLEALKCLNSSLPIKTIIHVLRQAAKACVIKRYFKKAGLLIKQALHLSREHFGCKHPKTADTLQDYGFYLLNVDSNRQSVKVYQTALDVRQCVFGGHNLHVAIAHEDLAYASYVHEYSSGKFQHAREHADKAMAIMKHLLPEDHLLLASSKRVKALILEEIAIDNHDKEAEQRLLSEAQDLHMSALFVAQRTFGEMNVQTAKHYGNLGRLYQSMKRFKEAEEMHLKAIQIKEKLLGGDDYEVALSVGHLASLYNYDMLLFEKAEKLYCRSVSIGIKLFGKGYSGLEYDYRGLLRVYTTLDDYEKTAYYTRILHHWKQLRDQTTKVENEMSPLNLQILPLSVEEIFPIFEKL